MSFVICRLLVALLALLFLLLLGLSSRPFAGLSQAPRPQVESLENSFPSHPVHVAERGGITAFRLGRLCPPPLVRAASRELPRAAVRGTGWWRLVRWRSSLCGPQPGRAIDRDSRPSFLLTVSCLRGVRNVNDFEPTCFNHRHQQSPGLARASLARGTSRCAPAGGEDEWGLRLPPLTLGVLITLDELLSALSGI